MKEMQAFLSAGVLTYPPMKVVNRASRGQAPFDTLTIPSNGQSPFCGLKSATLLDAPKFTILLNTQFFHNFVIKQEGVNATPPCYVRLYIVFMHFSVFRRQYLYTVFKGFCKFALSFVSDAFGNCRNAVIGFP